MTPFPSVLVSLSTAILWMKDNAAVLSLLLATTLAIANAMKARRASAAKKMEERQERKCRSWTEERINLHRTLGLPLRVDRNERECLE